MTLSAGFNELMLVKHLTLSGAQCLVTPTWLGVRPPSVLGVLLAGDWWRQISAPCVFPCLSPSIPQGSFVVQSCGALSKRRETAGSVGVLDTAPHFLMNDDHVHRSFSGSAHRSHQDLQSLGGWFLWHSLWKGLGCLIFGGSALIRQHSQRQTHFSLLFSILLKDMGLSFKPRQDLGGVGEGWTLSLTLCL